MGTVVSPAIEGAGRRDLYVIRALIKRAFLHTRETNADD